MICQANGWTLEQWRVMPDDDRLEWLAWQQRKEDNLSEILKLSRRTDDDGEEKVMADIAMPILVEMARNGL